MRGAPGGLFAAHGAGADPPLSGEGGGWEWEAPQAPADRMEVRAEPQRDARAGEHCLEERRVPARRQRLVPVCKVARVAGAPHRDPPGDFGRKIAGVAPPLRPGTRAFSSQEKRAQGQVARGHGACLLPCVAEENALVEAASDLREGRGVSD